MIRNAVFSVWFVAIYLIAYIVMLQFRGTREPAILMLLLVSPLLIFWMVYSVLKYGKYNGRELGDDDFGYEDRPKTRWS